jgi:hypothetical protein
MSKKRRSTTPLIDRLRLYGVPPAKRTLSNFEIERELCSYTFSIENIPLSIYPLNN